MHRIDKELIGVSEKRMIKQQDEEERHGMGVRDKDGVSVPWLSFPSRRLTETLYVEFSLFLWLSVLIINDSIGINLSTSRYSLLVVAPPVVPPVPSNHLDTANCAATRCN